MISIQSNTVKLIGMEHRLKLLPSILALCDRTFTPGERIGIEIYPAEIERIFLIDKMLSTRQFNIPEKILRSFTEKDRQDFVRSVKLLEKQVSEFRKENLGRKGGNTRLNTELAQLREAWAKIDFWAGVVLHFKKKGFVPVGIDSAMAHSVIEKNGKRFEARRTSAVAASTLTGAVSGVMLSGSFSGSIPLILAGLAIPRMIPTKYEMLLRPMREKKMSSAIQRQHLSGALMGGSHVTPIKRLLESNGLTVTAQQTGGKAGMIIHNALKPALWMVQQKYNHRQRTKAKRLQTARRVLQGRKK